MTQVGFLSKGCSRCKNCEESSDKCICLFCNKNATEENFKKLEEQALKVNNCSRFVATATEDTLMPMIKFAILFPLIMSLVKNLKIESVQDIKKNMVILLGSTISSIFSIGSALTSNYFSQPGKTAEDGKWKNKVVYLISMICPAGAKIISYQLFIFGLVLMFKTSLIPDLILILALVLPYIVSFLRALILLVFGPIIGKKHTLKKLDQLKIMYRCSNFYTN